MQLIRACSNCLQHRDPLLDPLSLIIQSAVHSCQIIDLPHDERAHGLECMPKPLGDVLTGILHDGGRFFDQHRRILASHFHQGRCLLNGCKTIRDWLDPWVCHPQILKGGAIGCNAEFYQMKCWLERKLHWYSVPKCLGYLLDDILDGLVKAVSF